MTWIDAEDAAVFPRTLLVVGRERRGHPHRPLRVAGARPGPERRDRRDPRRPGLAVRYVGLQEYGDGVTHLAVQRARIGRGADRSRSGSRSARASRASRSRPCWPRTAAARRCSACTSATASSTSTIVRPRSRRLAHLERPPLQGRDARFVQRDLHRDRDHRAGAHQCDAYQTNRNILLSDHARAQSVPNLEILTNDPTRCGHAASVGPVSDDELFYLMSRGIPEKEAERLIVFGFFAEVLDRVDIAEIREGLEQAIEQEIARGPGTDDARPHLPRGRRPRGRGATVRARPPALRGGEPRRRGVPRGGRDLLARALLPGRGGGRRRGPDDRVPQARLDVRPQHGCAADPAGDAAGRGVRDQGGATTT